MGPFGKKVLHVYQPGALMVTSCTFNEYTHLSMSRLGERKCEQQGERAAGERDMAQPWPGGGEEEEYGRRGMNTDSNDDATKSTGNGKR